MRSAASIILMACSMKTLLIKTHRPTTTYTKPHFFILNKGMNSGKPLKASCPNCFVCLLENPDKVDQVYWIAYALWKSRQLEMFLRGSVIPFITIGEYRKHFLRAIRTAEKKESQLEKLIQTLKLLEIQEQKIHVSLRMIETTRMAFFREFL